MRKKEQKSFSFYWVIMLCMMRITVFQPMDLGQKFKKC